MNPNLIPNNGVTRHLTSLFTLSRAHALALPATLFFCASLWTAAFAQSIPSSAPAQQSTQPSTAAPQSPADTTPTQAADASAPHTPSHGRARLLAKYSPGEVLHYQIEMNNISKGKSGGLVEDPEAASQLKQSTSVLVRLDVLAVNPSTPSKSASAKSGSETPAASKPASEKSATASDRDAAATAGTRIKVTYEKSDASVHSDAYDENAQNLVDQYRKLQGQSLEFTLGPDGRVGHLAGLDKVLADPSAAATAQGWMSNISPAGGFPKRGIEVGEKWKSEEKLLGAPLKGTVWRAESTYLRDEPCTLGSPHTPGLAAASASGPAPQETTPTPPTDSCAVVLTHFKILQIDPTDNLTPPAYAKAGLVMAGSWLGEGESLSHISLRTGFVVSVTQRATQQMDFTISTHTADTRLTYTGEVTSQTEIQLLDTH